MGSKIHRLNFGSFWQSAENGAFLIGSTEVHPAFVPDRYRRAAIEGVRMREINSQPVTSNPQDSASSIKYPKCLWRAVESLQGDDAVLVIGAPWATTKNTHGP